MDQRVAPGAKPSRPALLGLLQRLVAAILRPLKSSLDQLQVGQITQCAHDHPGIAGGPPELEHFSLGLLRFPQLALRIVGAGERVEEGIARDHVVGRQQLARLMCQFNGLGHVTAHHGRHGPHRGDVAEYLLAFGRRTLKRHLPFDLPQQGLRRIRSGGQGQGPGLVDTEPGPAKRHLFRQGLDPAQQGGQFTPRYHGQRVLFDEPRGSLKILRQQGMVHGFGRVSVLFVPAGGADVQLADGLRGPLLPPEVTQQIGEQVVVAVPAVFIVQGQDEQVALLEVGQHGLAIALTGEGVAQRPA